MWYALSALHAFMHALLSVGILFCPWPLWIFFSLNQLSLLIVQITTYVSLPLKIQEVLYRPEWVTPALVAQHCFSIGLLTFPLTVWGCSFPRALCLILAGSCLSCFHHHYKFQHSAQCLQHGYVVHSHFWNEWINKNRLRGPAKLFNLKEHSTTLPFWV